MSKKSRIRQGWNPVLIVSAVLFVAYWAVAIFVICVDPLRLYPWGMQPEISAAVSPQQKPELIAAETSDRATDLIVIGSSISAFYSPDDLRKWLSGTKHPVNISYFLPGYDDNKAVLSLAQRSPNVKRIILFYHHATYLQSPGQVRPGIPMYALDQLPFNDLRAVNFDTLRLSIEAVRHRPLYYGTSYFSDLIKKEDGRYLSYQSVRNMDELSKIIDRTRGELAAQSATKNCDDYPGLIDQLEPFAHELSKRGIRLDIMMPILSHAYYGDWLNTFRHDARFEAFFARDLAFRDCLVNRVSNLPMVKVHAFENNWIVNDMANFADPGHLHSDAASRYIFTHIDDDRYLITSHNVDHYLRKLRSDVLRYRVQNSNIPVKKY